MTQTSRDKFAANYEKRKGVHGGEKPEPGFGAIFEIKKIRNKVFILPVILSGAKRSDSGVLRSRRISGRLSDNRMF
jgi:hypothetical protein